MVAKEREQSRLIAAQEKREHKRLHGQVTKNVVGEGYGPGKGKSKTAMRKKKSAIWKKERDQKKLKARMERLESQKMDNLENFPDMDDYKYRWGFKMMLAFGQSKSRLISLTYQVVKALL